LVGGKKKLSEKTEKEPLYDFLGVPCNEMTLLFYAEILSTLSLRSCLSILSISSRVHVRPWSQILSTSCPRSCLSQVSDPVHLEQIMPVPSLRSCPPPREVISFPVRLRLRSFPSSESQILSTSSQIMPVPLDPDHHQPKIMSDSCLRSCPPPA
jgi:hypothetical protein